jgi:hypothetical protein
VLQGAGIAESVKWLGYGLDDKGIMVQFPIKTTHFSLSTALISALGPPSLLSTGYQGLFLHGLSGHGTRLTIHFHPVPWLRMCASISMACCHAVGQLYFYLQQDGIITWNSEWYCSENYNRPPHHTIMFLRTTALHKGGLLSLRLYKENNKLQDWKNVFTLHIPPWAPHTYDFVVLTSLTHPRKILLVVLQMGNLEIGKAKDLSAPLCIG